MAIKTLAVAIVADSNDATRTMVRLYHHDNVPTWSKPLFYQTKTKADVNDLVQVPVNYHGKPQHRLGLVTAVNDGVPYPVERFIDKVFVKPF